MLGERTRARLLRVLAAGPFLGSDSVGTFLADLARGARLAQEGIRQTRAAYAAEQKGANDVGS